MKREARNESGSEQQSRRKKPKFADDGASDAISESTADSSHSPEPQPDSASIKNFRVSKDSLAVLKKKGIKSFFPIQEKSYDAIFDGKHVIGRARTGTGKTLAFALPSVERLMESDSFSKDGVRQNRCRLLVLLPTRELAQQVAAEFEILECNRFKITTIVGGLPEYPQIQSLKQHGNVVVGTPGRTLDFLNRNILDLKKLKAIVLDEADQMLEMGFREDIDAILEHVFEANKAEESNSLGSKVQVLLFTATLPSWVTSLSKKYMTGRERVVIDVVEGQSVQTATGVRHLAILCGFHQRAKVLADVLNVYAANNGRCIVFTETKAQANQMTVDSGISHFCQVLHGDIQQKQREVTLKAFKEGRFRCLVATDVAARGLHVNDIELVVQMEPPKDIDTFVHRSGRTGRAGTTGINVVFFSVADAPFLMSIEKSTGIKFKRVGVPQPEELMKATADRIADPLTSLDEVKAAQIERFIPIAESMITKLGATEAVSRLLCEIGGASSKEGMLVMSTLTGREGFKTYEVVFKNAQINNKGYVWKALKNALGADGGVTDKLCSMTLRLDGKGCVFDCPPEAIEEWEKCMKDITSNPRNASSFSMGPVSELPDLDDPILDSSAMPGGYVDHRNPRAVGRRNGADKGGGRGGRGRGGFGGGRGGFGGGRGRPSNGRF